MNPTPRAAAPRRISRLRSAVPPTTDPPACDADLSKPWIVAAADDSLGEVASGKPHDINVVGVVRY